MYFNERNFTLFDSISNIKSHNTIFETISASTPGIFLPVFLIWFQGDLRESRTQSFLGYLSWKIFNSLAIYLKKKSFYLTLERTASCFSLSSNLMPAVARMYNGVSYWVQNKNFLIVGLSVFSDISYLVFLFWYVVAGECKERPQVFKCIVGSLTHAVIRCFENSS